MNLLICSWWLISIVEKCYSYEYELEHFERNIYVCWFWNFIYFDTRIMIIFIFNTELMLNY